MSGFLSGGGGIPVGMQASFPAEIPAGWLPCNGAAVSRTDYAALFNVIGESYGAGDGSTTFNLPDHRGVVERGIDDGRGLDSGRVLGTYQADQVKAHSHTTKHYRPGTQYTGSFGYRASLTDSYYVTSSASNVGTTAVGGSEVTVKNIATNKGIKY